MTVMQEYAKQAEMVGEKLWKRGRECQLGGRILTSKQINNLTSDERSMISSGWVSWAYCNYGCGELAGTSNYLVVRKDIADAEPGTMGTCGCVECCKSFNRKQD